MPLDLVARARSMDGSADLKWRNADHSLAYHIGGPRSGAQGRSLEWTNVHTKSPPNAINKNIRYNFANSKYSVSIPHYYYNGGPLQIKNLLATCWRLHYLKCSGIGFNSLMPPSYTQQEDNDHPCCKLVSQPGKETLPSTRISRWLS